MSIENILKVVDKNGAIYLNFKNKEVNYSLMKLYFLKY